MGQGAGFPRETVRFLAGLHANNTKAWFDAHRDEYEASYLAPAMAFVEAIGPKLARLDPGVHAEPRVNGSIMRIHRDVRFSKDKSPYKDHLDLWFWCGKDKGWDSPGFFFRLTPTELMMGAGMHAFPPPVLARYREAVQDDERGKALAAAVAKVRKAGYVVGRETYKKTPKGVDADHPRADHLRFGGLYGAFEGKHPKELGDGKFVDVAAKHFAAVSPIHDWLRALVG